jgi:hypothetical protein
MRVGKSTHIFVVDTEKPKVSRKTATTNDCRLIDCSKIKQFTVIKKENGEFERVYHGQDNLGENLYDTVPKISRKPVNGFQHKKPRVGKQSYQPTKYIEHSNVSTIERLLHKTLIRKG